MCRGWGLQGRAERGRGGRVEGLTGWGFERLEGFEGLGIQGLRRCEVLEGFDMLGCCKG